MGRVCTVKPAFFKNDELFEAEKKFKLPLRLAFIGLLTCCDRDGQFRWNPRELKLDTLPYDEVDFEEVLNALVSSEFIEKINDGESLFGQILSRNKYFWSNK